MLGFNSHCRVFQFSHDERAVRVLTDNQNMYECLPTNKICTSAYRQTKYVRVLTDKLNTNPPSHRTLMVPSILPDPVRDEVTNLYCPGNTSPLPHLANQTFRPRSAPPLVTPRPSHKHNFRSLNNSPAARSPDLIHSSPDSRLNGDVYPLFRSTWESKNLTFRPKTAAGFSTVGSERTDSPNTTESKRNLTRSKTAVARTTNRPSSRADGENLIKNVSFASRRTSSPKISKIRPKTSARSIST